QAFEITILRDERDALLPARGGDKCVVEERRLFLEYPPSFPSGYGRENTAAGGEGRAGRREDTATPFKRLEHAVLHAAGDLRSPRTRGKFLHHDSAQVGERKRSVEESEHLGLRFLI